MPIVNIIIAREGSSPKRAAATEEEKGRLIKGASDLLLEVLGKPLDATFVTIQEVELENWGWGGLPVDEYRKAVAARKLAAAPGVAACDGS
jgi:4-oxalocrotonate tautomerase